MTNQPSFEDAYGRLEKILTKMNQGELGLEESISLYEEADKLISLCSTKLDEAEKKIQILIKGRDGKAQTDEEGNAVLDNFENESVN